MSNCTCKVDIEAKLLERFAARAPEASGHKVQLDGYGLTFAGNSLTLRGYMPIKLTATYQLKKGGAKTKTTTQSMFFSYCPFCGAKLDATMPATVKGET